MARSDQRADNRELEGDADENFQVDTHGEPDEPGEGTFTRTAPTGGFELRVNSDHDDLPISEQMADVLDDSPRERTGGKGEPSRGSGLPNTPVPPPA